MKVGSSSRKRRAYTLLEVVGATTLFILVVSLLGTTTSTLVASRSQLRLASEIDTALTGLLDQVATSSFDRLVTNSFTPPDLCGTSVQGVGTLASSCTTVAGRQVVVQWALTYGPDAAGNGAGPFDAADSVTLVATAQRPDGSITTRTRTVAAPSPGWREGYATLSVRVTGEVEALRTAQRPLLLIDATLTEVVAAGIPDQYDRVMTRIPDGACTQQLPCRLALGTGPSFALTPDLTLDALTASTVGQVVAVAGEHVVKTATVLSRARATLDIDIARASRTDYDSTGDDPPHPGSVCVWVTLTDTLSTKAIPFCNGAADGRRIDIATYRPDPSSDTRIGIPADTALTVTADHPDGTCPEIESQKYHNGTTWVAASSIGVCSTWTWGTPAYLDPFGDQDELMLPASITPAAGVTGYRLMFDATMHENSRPATGWDTQPVFAKPRSATNCPSWPVACRPAWLTSGDTAAPEDGPCPQQHCLSSAQVAPSLAAVDWGAAYANTSTWPFAVRAAPGSTVAFQTIVTDLESDPVSVTVVSRPRVGLLEVCRAVCLTVLNEQLVVSNLAATADPATTEPLTWRYTAPADSLGGLIELRLSDGTNQRLETILLPATSGDPVAVRGYGTSVVQGDTTTIWARVFDDLGEPADGVDVTFGGLPAGSSVATPSTSSDGWVSATLDAHTMAAGPQEVSISIDGLFVRQVAPVSVAVTPVAAQVALSSSSLTLGQGLANGAATTVAVTDASGGALVGHPVVFAARTPTLAGWRGIDITPVACVTDASGTCTLPTVASSLVTPSATGSLLATAGSATASIPVTVTQRAARVVASQTAIAQGASLAVNAVILDGAGAPMRNQVASLTPAAGLTVSTPTVTSDASGRVQFTLSAAADAPAGPRLVQVRVTRSGTEDLIVDVAVTVTPTLASIGVEPVSLTVARGETKAVSVFGYDALGAPAPGAHLTPDATSCTSGLHISQGLTTGPDGIASLFITAPAGNATGPATCTVAPTGVSPVVFSVQVVEP